MGGKLVVVVPHTSLDYLRGSSNILFFCSNNPYSEPDADNSPNNDTDWDWGGGKASPCGSPGPNVDPDHQNAALTKTVLTGEDNAVSKWIFSHFPF